MVDVFINSKFGWLSSGKVLVFKRFFCVNFKICKKSIKRVMSNWKVKCLLGIKDL